MFTELIGTIQPDALKLALVLALSFFVGLEREEHKQLETSYAFGGVRTFPLIGLTSYALALLSKSELMPWVVGLSVLGVLMAISYFHKLANKTSAGLTTELSGIVIYVLGGLIQRDFYWIATTIGVLSVLLLEPKKSWEGLTRHIAQGELITLAKFFVLAAIVLPMLPDRELTPFRISPFKTWLVVVAVSGISFASYVLKRVLKGRGGIMLSAILGGAYSSTVTTVALARQAKAQPRPNLFAGSILTASAVMYLRLILLLAFFDLALATQLAPAFGVLAVLGGTTGWLVSKRDDGNQDENEHESHARNPLELRAAFQFAAIFVVVVILTHLARQYLGRKGLYTLSAIMGVTDVDPFILGLTQTSPSRMMPISAAAAAVAIAAASNNVDKALYAYAFADRDTGRKSAALLLILAALGLVPLVWL